MSTSPPLPTHPHRRLSNLGLTRPARGIATLVCLAAFLLTAMGATDHDSVKAPSGLTATELGGFVLNGAFGHSHNDYQHRTPLKEALAADMLSIEADVHLESGDLYVAHDADETRRGRTLRRLYLDPLFKAFKQRGGANPDAPFGGSVRNSGRPVVLLVDIKTEATATWRELERQLAEYPGLCREVTRDADGQATIKPGPVIVVVSGNRPLSLIRQAKHRRTAIDGRYATDLDTQDPPHLMPMISTSFTSLLKAGGITRANRDQLDELLHDFADKAAKEGRLARVWATPDELGMWRLLNRSQMQLINTDHPRALAAFLRKENRESQASAKP